MRNREDKSEKSISQCIPMPYLLKGHVCFLRSLGSEEFASSQVNVWIHIWSSSWTSSSSSFSSWIIISFESLTPTQLDNIWYFFQYILAPDPLFFTLRGSPHSCEAPLLSFPSFFFLKNRFYRRRELQGNSLCLIPIVLWSYFFPLLSDQMEGK